jgi:putative glutamine amidotransferase
MTGISYRSGYVNREEGDVLRPLIGVTCSFALEDSASYRLREDYVNAVSHTGGEAVILPHTDEQGVRELIGTLDGIMLSGGDDVDPAHYDEQPHVALGKIEPGRDRFELELVRAAIRVGTPILGICRGMQILYVAMGGKLIQDIPSEVKGAIKHKQEGPKSYPSHKVVVEKNSKLSGMIGAGEVGVNSFHHQAVKEPVVDRFIVSARASDSVIEAIEFPEEQFVLGVQWHPEAMFSGSPAMIEIFAAFVAEAAAKR